MDKDKLIVAQNCNSATAQVMAALVGAGSFSYEDVRANWGDLHGIVNANTFTAAAAQMVAAAMPGAQVLPTPPMPPAAPQAAPMPPSAPPVSTRPKSNWIREDAFDSIVGAVEYERLSGITFGSKESNFYCNQSVKAAGQLPNGSAIRNVATYPDAKVKPSDRLEGDWGPTLLEYADYAIDFAKMPSSFTRPPAYVR
jgi:hypothetical protein|tara:strand:- start:3895 stop:4485 length:591 start_codon:yes stop_codon:yes gene_type:complete